MWPAYVLLRTLIKLNLYTGIVIESENGKYCTRNFKGYVCRIALHYGKKNQRIGPTLFDKYMIY